MLTSNPGADFVTDSNGNSSTNPDAASIKLKIEHQQHLAQLHQMDADRRAKEISDGLAALQNQQAEIDARDAKAEAERKALPSLDAVIVVAEAQIRAGTNGSVVYENPKSRTRKRWSIKDVSERVDASMVRRVLDANGSALAVGQAAFVKAVAQHWGLDVGCKELAALSFSKLYFVLQSMGSRTKTMTDRQYQRAVPIVNRILKRRGGQTVTH